MEALVAIVLFVIGAVVLDQVTKKRKLQLASAQAAARLRHLRSGEFPSSCSWCKNTALARKLFVFERTPASWRAADLLSRLAECADAEVEPLASALTSEHPRWRRICTEKCAKEFFAAEHVPTEERFASCEYCSTRSPVSIVRCPNCGALRTTQDAA